MMMNRRHFFSAFTGGTLGALELAATPAVLASPIGKWDHPVEFVCLTFQELSSSKLSTPTPRLRGVGWKAEYRGKEYGEMVQMNPIYTIDEMFAAIKLLQARSDEALTEILREQA